MIETIGAIDENSGLELSAKDIKGIESNIRDRLRELAMKAVDKAREYDADFLGFTEKLHRTNLSAWKNLGSDWRKTFSEAEVEIVVDAKVVQTGIIGKKLDFRN